MIKIYKASAGSGKTFTLAREYITLILGVKQEDGSYRLARGAYNRHRHILAITFTNKATEEMKNRIIHELAVLAGREPGWTRKSDYLNDLTALFCCTEDQLKAAACNALDDLLHDFNYFNVSTIDAFFQMVLRTFAREAEIDGNYDVELDDELVISLGVNDLLSSLHTARDRSSAYLLQWLETYMTDKVDEGSTFNIFNRSSKLHQNLVKFFKNISNETFAEHRTEIMDYLADPSRLMDFDRTLAERVRARRKAIADACADVEAIIATRGIPEKGVLHSNTLGLIRKWRTGRPADGKEPGKTPEKIVANPEAAYVKAGLTSPMRDERLDDCLVRMSAEILEGEGETRFLDFLRKNLFHLGLLRRLEECISGYRSENSTILLSDTNAILNRIINDEDAPFVYERLGEQLENFLIDEFQDTSRLQWENLLPLVRQSLDYQRDCLVIGDEKQCIYRFRNSEPRLLRDLHTAFGDRSESRGNTPQENTNWRSSSDVVRFNNTLFSAIADVSDTRALYHNVVQLVSPKHRSHTGYVKVKDFSATEATVKDDRMAEMLDFMTEEFQRALDDGYRPADIAVLVRTRKEGAAVISHLLDLQSNQGRFEDVRLVSDQSITVSQSPAVRLIISVLRYLTSTDDVSSERKKSRREVARLLNRFEFFRTRSLDASTALHEALTSPEVIEEIASEAIAVNCLNLPTVVERIITRYIPTQERRSQNLFLCSFQDLVNEYVRNGSGDIRTFLQWWDEKGASTPVAGVADSRSLSVLTIHKAKGLEYKVVIVPFAGAKEINVNEVKWFEMPSIPGIPDEIVPPFIPLTCTSALQNTPFATQYDEIFREVLTDELNVLYVALTRAVDRLIIGLPKSRNRNIADYVREAIKKTNADYAAALSASIPVDAHSQFMPLGFSESGEFETGTAVRAAAEEKKSSTALTPTDSGEMPAYWSDDRDDLWEGTRVDNLSRYDFGVARQRGIVLHDLLARVRSKADIDSVIFKMTREGLIPEEEVENVRAQLDGIMADDHVALWFESAERVLIERSLEGESELRPDRVVWTAEGTIDVIDYKTGKENPARYARQVQRYVARLAAMGYENIRGFLWYLDSGEVVRCS